MIILSSRFDLAKGDQEQIKKRMDELTELRQLKQPLEYPLVGVSLNVQSVILPAS